MKGFIVLLAIFALCFAKAEPVPEADKLFELVRGLLAGLNEKGDINALVACLKGGEEIFVKIKQALEYLKNKNPDDLKKGLLLLFEAMRSLLDMLKPCMGGFEILLRLAQELLNPNIGKIIMKILTHPGTFFVDVVKALVCFIGGDYFCVGKSLGDILRFIFLSREEMPTADKLFELVRGLLAGLNEKGSINDLIACLKGGEDIFEKIKSALEHLRNKNPEELKKGLEILFAAMRQLMNMLKPCMGGFEILLKLAQALMNPNIGKIVMKILTHPGEFFVDVVKALVCFIGNDYFCVGKNLGDIMRFIFL